MDARVFAMCVVTTGLASAALGQSTQLVNLSSLGAQGHFDAFGPTISGNGRYVGFSSGAFDFVPGDFNGVSDAFVHDLWTGATTRVSLSTAGVQGNGPSYLGNLSADGRFAVFQSEASNLVAGDTNNASDVFVRDLWTATTERVSRASSGAQGNSESFFCSIAADGSAVVFLSHATNLVAGDTNGNYDAFVHDRTTHQTELASVSTSGDQANTYSDFPSISGDGQRVAFITEADNLVAGDSGLHPGWDVFVRDRALQTTVVATVSGTGEWANAASQRPRISPSGRFVMFDCGATNLDPADTNGQTDVFVHDLESGATFVGSLGTAGVQSNGFSLYPALSADDRFLRFESLATNLVPGDTNGVVDVFVRDLVSNVTVRASVGPDGAQGNLGSSGGDISADGRFVAFGSIATNFYPGDNSPGEDEYVRDLLGCAPAIVSYCTASLTSIPGCRAALTASGSPSLANPSGFALLASPVPGQSAIGIAYFGLAGPAATPIGTQDGKICAAPPIYRSRPGFGGGTIGVCDGSIRLTLADLIAAHAPGLIAPGAILHLGVWFREPALADGYALTDALWFSACP